MFKLIKELSLFYPFLNNKNLEQIRIGKYIELKLNATDEETAREQVELICDQLLANPVIENYRFELNEVKI